MKRVRVVHLTPSFGCGGLERVVANLIHHNQDLQVEHVVVSLSSDISFSSQLPPGVRCISIHKKEGLDLLAHFRLAKVLRQLKATALHTYNFATLEYHAIASLCGIQTHVHADHGLGGDDPHGKNRTHNTFRRAISTFIDHYVVVSNDLRDWAIQTIGVPERKVSLITNGVPLPEPSPLPEKAPGRLSLVIVGRLAPVKNHARLLDALAHTQREHPEQEIYCDIVGDGELMPSLKNKAQTLPNPHRVRFHGHQDDVLPFLERSDALILSSDYEAMPMTVLEAMAANRAVICPLVGGVSGFLSAEDACLVPGHDTVALADAILSLSTVDASSYADKVARARVRVASTYGIQSMVDKYNALYRGK